MDPEVRKIAAIFESGIDDNFFDWCCVRNGYGARYLAHGRQLNKTDQPISDIYIFGEKSANTARRHGSSIELTSEKWIVIGYWYEGRFADGKYVEIYQNGEFIVGNYSEHADGVWREIATRYYPDGTEELEEI